MSELAGSAAGEAPPQDTGVEAADAPLLYEQGLNKAEVLAKLMGEVDYVPEVPDQEGLGESPAIEQEGAVEAAKVADNTIPGLEAEKPADAPVEPKADEPVDAATAEDAPGAGKFKVRNADGSFAETPNVVVDFQIGEKVYKGKSLPDLVRMAYDGVAGQKAVVENRQLQAEVIPRIQQEANQRYQRLEAEYQAQLELNAAILQDATGETWAKNHEKFAQAQSPEAVAERAQQEAMQLRNTLAEQQADQYRATTYATYIKPALDFVAQECPDVSDTTKAGIIASITGDLLVQGRIPPEKYPELVNRMQGPYVQAVRAEQKRFADARAATEAAVTKAKAEAAAELREAQKKQNALVAGMKPVGGVPGSQIAKPLAPPRNKAEALDRIINRPYTG